MPPLRYDQFATNEHIDNVAAGLRTSSAELRAELKTEMADLRTDVKTEIGVLRGEMGELRGDLKTEMPQNLRLIVASQLATMLMLGGWVAAVS